MAQEEISRTFKLTVVSPRCCMLLVECQNMSNNLEHLATTRSYEQASRLVKLLNLLTPEQVKSVR